MPQETPTQNETADQLKRRHAAFQHILAQATKEKMKPEETVAIIDADTNAIIGMGCAASFDREHLLKQGFKETTIFGIKVYSA